jgi:3',5'-cyclic AMP phosphodiesterase CpdA
MLQWLKDDLAVNNSDWTIVIFHHPPYTKGSHDSDSLLGNIDQPIFAIREEFTPVFEQYGVDLAYSGHSHIYERSYYITGHYGLSPTFDPGAGMAELNNVGDPASGQGDEAYTQIAKNGFDDKVVYTVAGNGGKAAVTSSGYPHPAHYFSLVEIGSVVIDLDANSLEASFIGVNGEVLDSFVMTR